MIRGLIEKKRVKLAKIKELKDQRSK